MPSRRSLRRGWTWIDVTIALGVVGLLLGLLIPFLQHERERQRSIHCRNNLKQIGLALWNYYDMATVFPPGYVGDPNHPEADASTLDGPSGFGWLTLCLPLMESSPWYNMIDFAQPCWSPANQRVSGLQISCYLCPSATTSEPRKIDIAIADSTNPVATFGRSHYVANAGQFAVWRAARPLADWAGVANGVIYRNSNIRAMDVSDGTSNTVMAGEDSRGIDRTWAGVVPGAKACLPESESSTGRQCDAAAALVLFASGVNRTEPFQTIESAPTRMDQLRSAHPGGFHVLMVNGDVRFLSENLDPDVWAALCSRNGRDQIGSEF